MISINFNSYASLAIFVIIRSFSFVFEHETMHTLRVLENGSNCSCIRRRRKGEKNLDRSRSDLRESNMNVCHITSVIVEFCYGHLF